MRLSAWVRVSIRNRAAEAAARLEEGLGVKGGDMKSDAESVRSDMFGTLSMATPFLSTAIVSDFAPSAVQPDRDHPPASARSHSHFVPSSYPERPMRDAAPSTAGEVLASPVFFSADM